MGAVIFIFSTITVWDLWFIFLSIFGLMCLVAVLYCRSRLWILVKIFLYCFWFISSVWAIISANLPLAADGWLQILPRVPCLSFLGRQHFGVKRWWEGSVPFLIKALSLQCPKALWGLASLHWRLLNCVSRSSLNFSFEWDGNWKERKVKWFLRAH